MSVMEKAIGWLAPPLCVGCSVEGSAICEDCVNLITPFGERCWRCNRLSPGCRTCESCRHTSSPGRVYIFTNYEGLSKQLMAAYKFNHLRSAAADISRLMARIAQEYSDDLSEYLIMSIPTATSRMRQRGFGHSELLARHIAWRLGLERRDVLRRLGQTRQLGASREVRLRQLSSSFVVRRPAVVRNRRILLVDDVLTTGGTIIAATQAMRTAGAASVDALLFAKRL